MNDIKSMATLSEFIVARALNIETLSGVEWDLYDLMYNGRRVAVKSPDEAAEYDISVSPRVGRRASDLHIFTRFNGDGDAHNVKLWTFWVLSTPNIDRTFEAQETACLDVIRPIAIQTDYAGLRNAVDMVVAA
jgi:hypothetical protein